MNSTPEIDRTDSKEFIFSKYAWQKCRDLLEVNMTKYMKDEPWRKLATAEIWTQFVELMLKNHVSLSSSNTFNLINI